MGTVHIDLYNPYEASTDGFIYLIMLVDGVSKLMRPYAMKT